MLSGTYLMVFVVVLLLHVIFRPWLYWFSIALLVIVTEPWLRLLPVVLDAMPSEYLYIAGLDREAFRGLFPSIWIAAFLNTLMFYGLGLLYTLLSRLAKEHS